MSFNSLHRINEGASADNGLTHLSGSKIDSPRSKISEIGNIVSDRRKFHCQRGYHHRIVRVKNPDRRQFHPEIRFFGVALQEVGAPKKTGARRQKFGLAQNGHPAKLVYFQTEQRFQALFTNLIHFDKKISSPNY